MADNKLKPEEAAILECLREDARMSVSDIAVRTGMPISTARHRLGRMFSEGLAEVSVLIDPLKLGYQIWAIFEISVELSRIEDISRQLAAEQQIYFIGITTGRYDLWAAGIFKSNDDLFDFISKKLAHIEGIIETSTASILRLVKRDMAFDLRELSTSPEIAKPQTRKAKSTKPRKGRSVGA